MIFYYNKTKLFQRH